MAIGEKIKDLRKTFGMTQQQLGGVEFTKGYISQIEKGTVTPSMKVLNLIASRLSKPVSYFLDGEDDYFKVIEEKFAEGETLYIQQHYNKAAIIFKEIVDEGTTKSGIIYSNSMLYLGKCLYNLKDYKKAIKVLKEAIIQLSKGSLLEKLVDAYSYEGLSYFGTKNYNTAIESFENSLMLIEENSLLLHNYQARLQLNIATAYLNLGRLSIALQGFEKNIKFCKREHINETLLSCNVRSGYIQYLLGDLQQAKQRIIAANSLNKILNDEIVWVEIYNVLGIIVFKEGKPKQGLDLLHKSMAICQRMNYEWGYYVNVTDLLSFLIENNQLTEAEVMINSHYEKIEKLEDQKVFYKLMVQIAKLENLRGNGQKAVDLYITAIDNFVIMDDIWQVHNQAKELADLLMEVDPSRAKQYYNLSFEYSSQVTSLVPKF